MRKTLCHLFLSFDLKKFIKFGLIGVLNTIVDFAVFYVMDCWVIRDSPILMFLGRRIAAGPYLSNTVSYVIANIHSVGTGSGPSRKGDGLPAKKF